MSADPRHFQPTPEEAADLSVIELQIERLIDQLSKEWTRQHNITPTIGQLDAANRQLTQARLSIARIVKRNDLHGRPASYRGDDVDTASPDLTPRFMPVPPTPINPECADRKHRNCNGAALHPIDDRETACFCSCHKPGGGLPC